MNDLSDARDVFRFILDASFAMNRKSKSAAGVPLFGGHSELRDLYRRCMILAADELLRDVHAVPLDSKVAETIAGIVVSLYVLGQPIWKKVPLCDFVFLVCRQLLRAAHHPGRATVPGQKSAFFRAITSRSVHNIHSWIMTLS